MTRILDGLCGACEVFLGAVFGLTGGATTGKRIAVGAAVLFVAML